ENFLALDQNVGLGKVADLRVHRHHRAAANDVAPVGPAAVLGQARQVRRLRCGGARREQIETCGGNPGRRGPLQKVTPGIDMILRPSSTAQLAHSYVLPFRSFAMMTWHAFWADSVTNVNVFQCSGGPGLNVRRWARPQRARRPIVRSHSRQQRGQWAASIFETAPFAFLRYVSFVSRRRWRYRSQGATGRHARNSSSMKAR